MTVPTLTGRVVRLEALEERHRELLRPVAQDPRIWTATLTHAMGGEFDVWFDATLAYVAPFTFRLGHARGLSSLGIDKTYVVTAFPF